jgi:hypothetical protein
MRLRYLIDPLENCPPDAPKRAVVVEQARSPVRSHGERLNFKYNVAGNHVLSDFYGILRVADRLPQRAKPSLKIFNDQVADFAGTIVEFERGGGEKTTAGENFIFRIVEPIFAKSPQTREAVSLKSGTDDCLHENAAGFLHNCALKVFFRTEVGEEATFADLQRGGELADSERFEALEGSNVDSPLQNCAASLYTARAPALVQCSNNIRRGGRQWLARTD